MTPAPFALYVARADHSPFGRGVEAEMVTTSPAVRCDTTIDLDTSYNPLAGVILTTAGAARVPDPHPATNTAMTAIGHHKRRRRMSES